MTDKQKLTSDKQSVNRRMKPTESFNAFSVQGNVDSTERGKSSQRYTRSRKTTLVLCVKTPITASYLLLREEKKPPEEILRDLF